MSTPSSTTPKTGVTYPPTNDSRSRPNATRKDINEAYKKHSIQLHRDKNKQNTNEASRHFQALSNAKEELLNPNNNTNTTQHTHQPTYQHKQDQFKGTPFGQQPRPTTREQQGYTGKNFNTYRSRDHNDPHRPYTYEDQHPTEGVPPRWNPPPEIPIQLSRAYPEICLDTR